MAINKAFVAKHGLAIANTTHIVFNSDGTIHANNAGIIDSSSAVTNTDFQSALANTNAFVANVAAEVDLLNTNLTNTNTAVRVLIDDRMQVANVVPTINSHLQGGTGVDYYSNGMISIGQEVYTNSDVTFGSASISGIAYPTADGVNRQVIMTDGSGTLSFESLDSISSEGVNQTASIIPKGTPVYQVGTSGFSLSVAPADASDSSKMPAVGIAGSDMAAEGGEALILHMGQIKGVDTSAFSEGDVIYVASGGGYTNVPPTGQTVLLQNLGKVTKVDASNGGGVIMGPGRTNAVPNLDSGNIFLGNTANQAEITSLDTAVGDLDYAKTAYTAANSFVTANYTTNTTFQAALANTNLAIADRIQVANLNTTLADYWPSANIITHVSTEVAALVNSAPSTLDTLNELADALGDDPNFATTLTTNLSQKLGSTATVTLTGDATGSASFSSNAVSVAVTVSDDFASNTYFQAYVSNTNPRLTTLETAGYITSSDTTQYLQVANVSGYIPANTSTTSAALSGNTVTFTRADSTTFDVDLTPIVGVGGSVANTENISNQVFKTKQTGANTRTFVVTVGTKTANSPFQGGSASAYFIDGEEVPGLTLVPGFTYRFDQSDSTNNSHLIKFWRDANKTTAYTTGISDTGTAGSVGAYTDFTVTANTPMTLFYQCINHSYMGGQIAVLSDTSPKYVEVSNLDIYWPSANVIQALNDFQPSLTLESFSVNTLAANGGGSLAYNDQTGTFAFKPADLSNLSVSPTVVSNTAPALSGNGSLWFDEDDATLYIEYDGVFVDAAPVVGSTPNNFISYSGNNTLRLITTAGEFIDADLSSIGGGGGVSGTDEDLTGTARTYTANGTATTFAASYSRANPEDVFVSVDGLDQRPTTDYTINGANVTFGTAPDSGSTVMIRTFNGLLGTNTASFDLNSYTANGTATDFFSPSSQATLEDLLITVNGVVQRPTTDYTLSAQTVSFGTAPINNSTVAIRSIRSRIAQVTETNQFVFANNTTIDQSSIDQDIKIATYTANGTATSFAANTSTITLEKSIVAINGILQRPTTDYTLSSTDVVFGSAPANNDIVSIREFNTAGQVINTNKKTWEQVHSNQTLEINKAYFVDTTNTAITVTLPLGKSMGDEVRIIDAVGKSSNNNITVNGNGTKIMGSSSDMTVSTNRAAFSLVYYNATQGWLLMEV